MTFSVHGLPVARGIAIGRAVLVASSRMDVAHYFVNASQVQDEIGRVRHARNAVHIQIAGSPGRHEPRAGEINYAGFFRAVDAAGFRGWVGAEYTPLTSTEAGLRWLRSA